METRVRFELTNNSFAGCSLKPLEYLVILGYHEAPRGVDTLDFHNY